MEPYLIIPGLLGHLALAWQVARLYGHTAVDRFWLATAAFHTGIAVIPLLMTLSGWWGAFPAVGFVWLLVLVVSFPRWSAARPMPLHWPRGWKLGPGGWLLALALAGIFVCAFVWRGTTPLYRFDELMYHASKVMYWNQQQSLAYFATHNFRHNSLTAAADYWFLYPLLFGYGESVARSFHALQWLFLAGAIAALLREWRVRWPVVAVTAGVVFLLPVTVHEQANIKPEILLGWAMIGFCRYFAATFGAQRQMLRKLIMLSWFLCTAIALKFTSVLLVPLFALALLVALFRRTLGGRPLLRLAAAGCAFAFASGVAWTVGNNLLHYHGLFGPQLMGQQVRAATDLQTISVHAARAGFIIAGWPWLPGAPLQAAVQKAGNRIAHASGAARQLTGEYPGPFMWPGAFTYERGTWNRGFSWFFWSALLIAVIATARSVARVGSPPSARLRKLFRPSLMLYVPAAAYFTGLLLTMRWQASARLPERFLIPVVALLITVSVIHSFSARNISRRWLGWLAFALLGSLPGAVAWAQLWQRTEPLREGSMEHIENSEFAGIAQQLPPASRVLLVGHQGAGDYLLFDPHAKPRHSVIPWGIRQFSAQRMEDLMAQFAITHVVLSDHWQAQLDPLPPLAIAPFRAWLDDHGFVRAEVSANVSAPSLYLKPSSAGPRNTLTATPNRLPPPEPASAFAYRDIVDPLWGPVRAFADGWKQSGPLGFLNDENFPLVRHGSALDTFTVVETQPNLIIYHHHLGHMQPLSDNFFVLYAFEREQWIGLLDRKLFGGDYQVLPDGGFHLIPDIPMQP